MIGNANILSCCSIEEAIKQRDEAVERLRNASGIDYMDGKITEKTNLFIAMNYLAYTASWPCAEK